MLYVLSGRGGQEGAEVCEAHLAGMSEEAARIHHSTSLGCNILLFSELGVKSTRNPVTKSYIQAIWLPMLSRQLLIPFWNSVVGQMLAFVSVILQLWPLLSAFPAFFFSQLCGVYPARASPGVNQQNSEEQSQLRAAWNGLLSARALGSREAMKQGNRRNILKEPSDLCLHSLKMLCELQPWAMN